MSWENLTVDILEDFASFAPPPLPKFGRMFDEHDLAAVPREPLAPPVTNLLRRVSRAVAGRSEITLDELGALLGQRVSQGRRVNYGKILTALGYTCRRRAGRKRVRVYNAHAPSNLRPGVT